jgi:predicted nucleotidyltransferase component of viral defense system
MLHYHCISPKLLAVLKRLTAHTFLHDFALAGGTALTLHIGHRLSVDLDLFSVKAFDSAFIAEELRNTEQLEQARILPNTINCYIDTIKIDFIAHRYPLLAPLHSTDDLRLFSLEDIAAMKLSAIGGRGAKKDFYDVALLLEIFSLSEMITLFAKKYPHADTFHVVRALNYFDDAESDDPIFFPPLHNQIMVPLSWDDVKKRMVNAVQIL